MNEHPVITRRILEKFHFPKHLSRIARVAALHHEPCNDRGYPRGLTCSPIPPEAKVFDVFDALPSPRDYPKYNAEKKMLDCERMPLPDVLALIDQQSGRQFDDRVVEAFRKCVPEALLCYRGTHFAPEYVDGVLQGMKILLPQAPPPEPGRRPHREPSGESVGTGATTVAVVRTSRRSPSRRTATLRKTLCFTPGR